jgi:hypothetical protein
MKNATVMLVFETELRLADAADRMKQLFHRRSSHPLQPQQTAVNIFF